MGAWSSTEEGVRRAMQELRIPRDATNFLADQLTKRKSEIMALLREEMNKAMQKIDFLQLVRTILKEYDLEVTVRCVPRKR